MSDPVELHLSDLVLEASVQSRSTIHQPTVNEYEGLYRDGVELPPIRVVRLEKEYDSELVVAGGYHRVTAARLAGRKTIMAIVTDGTIDDAIQISLADNSTHGRRMSIEDMERAVGLALEHPVLREMKSEELARYIGCSTRTLQRHKKAAGLSRNYERHYTGTLDEETVQLIRGFEDQFPEEAEALLKGELVKSKDQLKEFSALPKHAKNTLAPLFLGKNLSVDAARDIANLRPTSPHLPISAYISYSQENPEDATFFFDGVRCRVDIVWVDIES